MAEQTAVWKFDRRTGEIFTEFDFLSVLGMPSDTKMLEPGCGIVLRSESYLSTLKQ